MLKKSNKQECVFKVKRITKKEKMPPTAKPKSNSEIKFLVIRVKLVDFRNHQAIAI